ncbi:hypothetical protein HZA85_00795 [Candidatus Uhrbacteria bacterium]|nr:hypothetical protein [Candidatus Uhrbacteria bacterium]
MDELMTELRHLGLSDKESAVYLASLELGPAAVQDISHKSKINRATTYVMIEALSARGLMSTFVRGKKRFYVPENPDRLVSILRMQQKELEEKEHEFQKALPLLLALYNAEGAKPQIRYVEGFEGLKTVHQTFEKLEGEYMQILPLDDAMSAPELEADRPRHVSALLAERTAHRILAITDKYRPADLPDVGIGEMRMIPASEFPMHGEIVIRGNHVFLFSYRSAVLSVVIVSKEIADAVRVLFELAWKGAQEFPSKKNA